MGSYSLDAELTFKPEEPVCRSCPYWREKDGGICLRYPRPLHKGADEWCGEHWLADEWADWVMKERARKRKNDR